MGARLLPRLQERAARLRFSYLGHRELGRRRPTVRGGEAVVSACKLGHLSWSRRWRRASVACCRGVARAWIQDGPAPAVQNGKAAT